MNGDESQGYFSEEYLRRHYDEGRPRSMLEEMAATLSASIQSAAPQHKLVTVSGCVPPLAISSGAPSAYVPSNRVLDPSRYGKYLDDNAVHTDVDKRMKDLVDASGLAHSNLK